MKCPAGVQLSVLQHPEWDPCSVPPSPPAPGAAAPWQPGWGYVGHAAHLAEQKGVCVWCQRIFS